MYCLILGEILVAKVINTNDKWIVDCPTTFMRQHNFEHIIQYATYESYDKAVNAAKRLVPEQCRNFIRILKNNK